MSGDDSTFKVLDSILGNSQFALTIADLDGILTVFNEAAERLTLYSREEVLGTSVTRFYRNEQECFALWEKVARHGKVEEYETELIRKDGSHVPISLSVAEIHDQNGRVVGSIGISVDQSDKTKLASALDRERSRVRFYNDVLRHDIRNAVQTISGYLQMFTESARSERPEADRKAIDVCLRQIRRIRDLIENVGLLEKIESQGENINKPLNMKAMLQDVIGMVRDAYSDREVNFEVSLPMCGRVLVYGCPLLQDALFNLVDNAVAHNSLKEPWVKISLAVDENMCEDMPGQAVITHRIAVEDNGPGIAPENRDEIFDRFVKLRVGGSGLGLSVVKAVAERCGGRIWVEDRVPGRTDDGSRFVLELYSESVDRKITRRQSAPGAH